MARSYFKEGRDRKRRVVKRIYVDGKNGKKENRRPKKQGVFNK